MYTVPTKAGPIGITAISPSTAPVYRNVLLSAQAIAGPAATIGKTSGVNQYGTVNTTLAAPLVVALRDVYGNGIVGQQITFTDGGAGGTFSANTVTTGAAGAASVSYTLPKKAQYIVLTATFGSISAGSAEHAVAGPASSVAVNTGNNQSVKVGTALKLLSVIVKDQYGNVVSGATINFSDGVSGGSFSSTTATTNLGGTASTTYTAPSTPQVVHVSATVSGLTPALFTETVHQ
jgi:adhesin/invasin